MVQAWTTWSAVARAIKAEVPLSEMFGYATQLRSMTQGRATYTMEFKHYAEARATWPRPSSPHARNKSQRAVNAC